LVFDLLEIGRRIVLIVAGLFDPLVVVLRLEVALAITLFSEALPSLLVEFGLTRSLFCNPLEVSLNVLEFGREFARPL